MFYVIKHFKYNKNREKYITESVHPLFTYAVMNIMWFFPHLFSKYWLNVCYDSGTVLRRYWNLAMNNIDKNFSPRQGSRQ